MQIVGFPKQRLMNIKLQRFDFKRKHKTITFNLAFEEKNRPVYRIICLQIQLVVIIDHYQHDKLYYDAI